MKRWRILLAGAAVLAAMWAEPLRADSLPETARPGEETAQPDRPGIFRERKVLTVIPEETSWEEGEILYSGVRKEDAIPETAWFTPEVKTAGETGEETAEEIGEEEVLLPLLWTEYRNPRKEALPDIPLVFHEYGADAYEFEGAFYSEEAIMSGDIALPGLGTEGIAWDGEPYTDESGGLCRRALLRAGTTVYDCLAHYGGNVTLPERTVIRTVREYVPVTENTEDAPETESAGASEEGTAGRETGLKERLAGILRQAREILSRKSVQISLLLAAALSLGAVLTAKLYGRLRGAWREKTRREKEKRE